MAKNPKQPTPEQIKAAQAEKERRQFIELLAGYDTPPETIAVMLVPPISVEELQADYAKELEMGPAKRRVLVLQKFHAAIDKGNVTAIIYYTKVMLGWRDAGAPQSKETPEASDRAPPTTMPSAKSLEEKILRFQAPSSRRS